MENAFGMLLRECRKQARLKQTELAQKIHIDGSMISRFETGKALASPATLQELINALALHDIPREKLDELWKAAGYYRTQIFDAPVADPIVAFIHQEFEKLESDEGEVLSEDLRSIIEIDQEYFSVQKASRDRKWAAARESLLSLRDVLELRFQHWYLRIDQQLARCSHSTGDYAEALRYYESALWSARLLEEYRKEAEILINQGDVYRRSGGAKNWRDARRSYEQAKKIFEKEPEDRRGIANCLRKIAGAYMHEGLPKDAEKLCDESLDICEDEGYIRGIYKAWQHKAWACIFLGRWQEAAQLCEKALEMVKSSTSDGWELAKAHWYLAQAYHSDERIQEAEKAFESAVGLLSETGNQKAEDDLLLGMMQLGLARVYLEQLKKPEAIESARLRLRESLDSLRGFQQDFEKARVLHEQGGLLLELGRYGKAQEHLEIGAQHLGELGNVFHYADALTTLCELYYRKKDFEKVYRTAETARKADNGLIDYRLAKIGLIVGKARIDDGAYSQALDAFSVACLRALSFNEKAFDRTCADVSDEVDRVAQKIGPGVALKICQSQIEFWEDGLQRREPSERELVQKWVESMREKRRGIKALTPVD